MLVFAAFFTSSTTASSAFKAVRFFASARFNRASITFKLCASCGTVRRCGVVFFTAVAFFLLGTAFTTAAAFFLLGTVFFTAVAFFLLETVFFTAAAFFLLETVFGDFADLLGISAVFPKRHDPIAHESAQFGLWFSLLDPKRS